MSRSLLESASERPFQSLSCPPEFALRSGSRRGPQLRCQVSTRELGLSLQAFLSRQVVAAFPRLGCGERPAVFWISPSTPLWFSYFFDLFAFFFEPSCFVAASLVRVEVL